MTIEDKILKAIAAAQSQDRSQNHTVTPNAGPLEQMRQLPAKHDRQRALEREMSGLATHLETVDELKIFLAAVMQAEVDTVKVCESVPSGGFRGDKPNLRLHLPQWIQDGIGDRVRARVGYHR